MKQVVFLINSLAGGGAEKVVSILLNHFVEKYECHLFLLESKIAYDLDKRINVISLDEDLQQSGLIKLLRLMLIAYKLSKIVKKHNFPEVISFLYRANYVNILAKYFSNHKVIISERIAPSSMYKDGSISSKISKFLIKNLYNKADEVISASKAIKNDLMENFSIRTKQNVIYNPYNIETIINLSKNYIDINIDKTKSIIAVGSLTDRKNYQLIINAFARIINKNYILYILGIGNNKDKLGRLVQALELNDRVIFLGFDNNPYKYLTQCGVFVLGSNSEGFPNVLMEALACDLPVIATDCLSGPREILAPNTDYTKQLTIDIELAEYGILTPVNSIEKLADAMNLMISNKELKNNYKNKARMRVNDFNLDKIATQYEKVLCAE